MTEVPPPKNTYFGRTEITGSPGLTEGSADAATRNFATRAIAGRDRAKDLSAAVSAIAVQPISCLGSPTCIVR